MMTKTFSFRFAAVALLGLSLTACGDMSDTQRSTLTGAGIGAIGGAALGSLSGNAGWGAAIGAGIGGASGYAIGRSRNR